MQADRLHELPAELVFAIAFRSTLPTFCNMLCASATLRSSLLRGMPGITYLELECEDVTVRSADMLASLPNLRWLFLCGAMIDVQDLRTCTRWRWNSLLPDTTATAMLVAAFLRQNHSALSVVTPSTEIDVSKLRAARTSKHWSSFAKLRDDWTTPPAAPTPDTPADDFSCVLAAGLLDESIRFERLLVDLTGLGCSSGTALAAAEHRCGPRGHLVAIAHDSWSQSQRRFGRAMESKCLVATPMARMRLNACREAHRIHASPSGGGGAGPSRLRSLWSHRHPLTTLAVLLVAAGAFRWLEHEYALGQGYKGGARLSHSFLHPTNEGDLGGALRAAMIAQAARRAEARESTVRAALEAAS